MKNHLSFIPSSLHPLIPFFLLLLIPSSLFSQTLPAYLPTNGLVAWYPFNGNANDESGNGLNASMIDITFNTDRLNVENNAIALNNSSSYLFINDTENVNPNQISVSIWIKPTNQFQEDYIIHKSTDFGNDRHWGIRTTGQGLISVEGRINDIYFD